MSGLPPTARRLSDVFEYIGELAAIRQPVKRTLNGYSRDPEFVDGWPDHPLVRVQRGESLDNDGGQESGGTEPEPLVRVRRPGLTPCPRPPRCLRDWLLSGWDDPTRMARVVDSKNRPGLLGDTTTIRFSDDDERVSGWDQWRTRREEWAEAERPAVQTRRLYERLHEVWTLMRREGDRLELVAADGMLHRPMSEGASREAMIEHPVLIQRIRVEFDSAAPEFRLGPEGDHAELHRPLLSLVPGLNSKVMSALTKELEEEAVVPFGGMRTTGFLRRLVQGLFVDGEFSDMKGDRRAHPTVWRDPVIFVRPRSAGLHTIIKSIVEDLRGDSPDIPRGLIQIAGGDDDRSAFPNEPPPHRIADDGLGPRSAPRQDEILFSKAANREQLQIARRLRKTDSVLVQGPPGTGKTHTIANLVGHFLEEGKTVLVTSHTSKALSVLRGQIDEKLQPLCLSVLKGDAESRDQLRRAVQDIVRRVGRSNAEELLDQAEDLRARHSRLWRREAHLRERLRAARYGEIEELVTGGETVRPTDAAKQVRGGEDEHGWLPGPIEHGANCSLSDSEVRELYASNEIVPASDEQELRSAQPSPADLPDPTGFRRSAGARTRAVVDTGKHRSEFWDYHAGTDLSADRLGELLRELDKIKSMLAADEPWLGEVLFAGWTGGGRRRTWDRLVNATNGLVENASNTMSTIAERDAKLPPSAPAEEVASTLAEIVKHLERRRRLGRLKKLMKPGWRRVIAESRTYGREPRDLADFMTLLDAAGLQRERRRFVAHWNRLMGDVSGPLIADSDTSPELTAESWVREIRKRIEWRERLWEPFRAGLGDVGFRYEALLDSFPGGGGQHGDLDRIRAVADAVLGELIEGRMALARVSELDAVEKKHRLHLLEFPESRAARALKRALAEWNPDAYEEAHFELARIEGLRNVFDRRRVLLEDLADTAPEWASAIARRKAPYHDRDEPPSEPGKAWRWLQLKQELDRRTEDSINGLVEAMGGLRSEVRRLAGEIIDRGAWAAQCDRIGLEEQAALVGFVKTVEKMGKGFGKKVPALKAAARKLLQSARRAVPVWIMPLNRVYESFDPGTTKFDVVIIDEASQSDVTALAALYLGRRHIIVGDNEQVTPDAIGMRLDDVDGLIETYLDGIPNAHLYDGQTSIYDLAETSFVGGVVRLREHFRCVPEIIQFSNTLSYDNAIRPLREPSSAGLRPAIVSQRVQGVRVGHRNNAEAAEIASLIAACLRDPAYRTNERGEPTSFGVITLLGSEQATAIGEKLWEYLGSDAPDAFTKHRLLCGTAAQFQGDERDVVFLSMVDGPPKEGKHWLRGDGQAKVFRKRYNVAVSRARNQLWVVHSLDPEAHLKEGDLRRRLIQHARDPHALMRTMEEQSKRAESEFERRVLRWLQNAGYRVRAQWPVGCYRIDLVVAGADSRLAVECDGDRWHPPEELLADMQRQADLERLGWRFARIRGSTFFRDPECAMAQLTAKLDGMGIVPLGEEPRELEADTDLLERIRRDAEAIRREREAEDDDLAGPSDLLDSDGDTERDEIV